MKILNLSLSLITVDLVHSKSQPYSSNQCDTARLDQSVRVRVNSSVRRAGRDRVRVSNQDVVETGYAAPSS